MNQTAAHVKIDDEANAVGELIETLRAAGGCDARWLSIAQTHLQEDSWRYGVQSINRSTFETVLLQLLIDRNQEQV